MDRATSNTLTTRVACNKQQNNRKLPPKAIHFVYRICALSVVGGQRGWPRRLLGPSPNSSTQRAVSIVDDDEKKIPTLAGVDRPVILFYGLASLLCSQSASLGNNAILS
jgi:hypothetical protein